MASLAMVLADFMRGNLKVSEEVESVRINRVRDGPSEKPLGPEFTKEADVTNGSVNALCGSGLSYPQKSPTSASH